MFQGGREEEPEGAAGRVKMKKMRKNEKMRNEKK